MAGEEDLRQRAAQLVARESSKRFGPLKRIFLIGIGFGLLLAALIVMALSD